MKLLNVIFFDDNKRRHLPKLLQSQILFVIFILLVSCKKLVEIPPSTNLISSGAVFSNDEAAIGALTGIYIEMGKATTQTIGGFTGLEGVSILTALSSDELVYFDAGIDRYKQYHFNSLNLANSTAGTNHWTPLYKYVFRCNDIIEGLNSKEAEALTPIIKQQLMGEAKFLRAFLYFYLTNMYGALPLVLTTDYNANTILARSPSEDVYKQIIADLVEAKNLLSGEFLDVTLKGVTTERVRPTKWSAMALLARVYLYAKEYQKAADESSLVINNITQFSLTAINSAFLKNSKETIWQLQPTTLYFNTDEARALVVPATGPSATTPVYLTDLLLNEFEPGDQRSAMGNWIDSTIYTVSTNPVLVRDTVYYPYKYKKSQIDSTIVHTTSVPGYTKMSEYLVVMRIAEQYLIRSEARTMLNDIGGARQDLLAIRNRAGLAPATLTANDQSSLQAAIAHERRVELFTEWGHRWFDLKRTGKVDAVMNIATPIKSNGLNQWQTFQQLYPIPVSDIQMAPNLIQNPGY